MSGSEILQRSQKMPDTMYPRPFGQVKNAIFGIFYLKTPQKGEKTYYPISQQYYLPIAQLLHFNDACHF